MFSLILMIIVFVILQMFGVQLIIKMLKNSQKIEEYRMNGDDVLRIFLMKKNRALAVILLVDWSILLVLIISIVNNVMEL